MEIAMIVTPNPKSIGVGIRRCPPWKGSMLNNVKNITIVKSTTRTFPILMPRPIIKLFGFYSV